MSCTVYIQADRETCRQTYMHIDIQRQTYTCRQRHTCRQTHMQTERQTHRQTDRYRQADRQIYRQADIHADIPDSPWWFNTGKEAFIERLI